MKLISKIILQVDLNIIIKRVFKKLILIKIKKRRIIKLNNFRILL